MRTDTQVESVSSALPSKRADTRTRHETKTGIISFASFAWVGVSVWLASEQSSKDLSLPIINNHAWEGRYAGTQMASDEERRRTTITDPFAGHLGSFTSTMP